MFSNRDFSVGWAVMESGPRGTIMKEWMKLKFFCRMGLGMVQRKGPEA